MVNGSPSRRQLTRVPSGVPGLDDILSGGFLTGGAPAEGAGTDPAEI